MYSFINTTKNVITQFDLFKFLAELSITFVRISPFVIQFWWQCKLNSHHLTCRIQSAQMEKQPQTTFPTKVEFDKQVYTSFVCVQRRMKTPQTGEILIWILRKFYIFCLQKGRTHRQAHAGAAWHPTKSKFIKNSIIKIPRLTWEPEKRRKNLYSFY